MPPFIAFWNPTVVNGWEATRFRDRLNALDVAVTTARAARTLRVGALAEWLFLAPEYTFAGVDRNRPKAAEHVGAADLVDLLRELTRISGADPTLLLAPGTIAHQERAVAGISGAKNTSYAFRNGMLVWSFSKRLPVGEVTVQEAVARRLVFHPGLGYGKATVNAVTYGAEICRDASHGGTLPGNVQRQVVIGAGVAHYPGNGNPDHYIANKATELQIVADYGSFGVYDYRNGLAGQAIAPYAQGAAGGAAIHYFDCP
jgi:hypothetical protein